MPAHRNSASATPEPSAARRLCIRRLPPHSVAWFAEPLLAAHDRASIELFCYAAVASPDAVTGGSANWPITGATSMARRRGRRRNDPCGPHRRAGRPDRSHRRQPAAGLRAQAGPGPGGLPAGSRLHLGSRAMDAFLADDFLAPPGADALFSEPSSACRGFRWPMRRRTRCRRSHRYPHQPTAT